MASHITELASRINSNTTLISDYLTSNGLPHPSFGPGGPITLGIKTPEIEQARSSTIDALQELLDLLRGPMGCLFQPNNPVPLQIVAKYKVALKLPPKGQISFEDLAAQCDVQVDNLRRAIRYVIAHNRLFSEPEPGFVAHSASSMALAKDEITRAGLEVGVMEFEPSFSKTLSALEKFNDKEPNHTGYSLAHDTEESMFDHMRSHPEKMAQFSKAMACYSRASPGNSEASLVQNYDWKGIGSGTLVDVGGAEGYVSYAIAKEHPDLNIIVQDLPDVVAAAQTNSPASGTRVSFQAHDIFTPQPVVADAYLYRWVFHDWPDHYVKRAVENLVPALRTGAKVIVNESLCPPPNKLPLSMERNVRHMDMLMLSLNNSRLRTVQEWQQIFKAADPRFGQIKCIMPKGSFLAILEVVWEG